MIQRMNSVRENAKSRRRAKALNKPKGHVKDAEKGRAEVPHGVYSAEDLRGLGEETENSPYFRRS